MREQASSIHPFRNAFETQLHAKDRAIEELRAALTNERRAHENTRRMRRPTSSVTVSFLCGFFGMICGSFFMIIALSTASFDVEQRTSHFQTEAPDGFTSTHDASPEDGEPTGSVVSVDIFPAATMTTIMRCPRSFALFDQEPSITASTIRFHAWQATSPLHGSNRSSLMLVLLDQSAP